MTATDDVRAEREGLVARLRAVNCCAYAIIFDDAADLIETQAAEIKRLTEERDIARRISSELAEDFGQMRDRKNEEKERAILAEAEVARLREALEWALDNSTDSDHPHYPYREDGRWVSPYLVSGTPLGGGVGHASFETALEAVQQAAALQPRSPSHG